MDTIAQDARDPDPVRRVVVEGVRPQIEGGPVKRTVGELLDVSADVFADGHDLVQASLLVLAPDAERWREVPMESLGNDRWSGTVTVAELGTWHYAVRGWIDPFATWQRDTLRKVEAGLDVEVELLDGALLVEDAATRAPEQAARTLRAVAVGFRQGDTSVLEDDDPGLATAMSRLADRSAASTSAPLALLADREQARFSAWYELFPRSFGAKGAHGTLKDAEALVPYVAGMGFDVLYLPPIHPIGLTNRKGKNNSLTPKAEDVGSPWAIGGPEGGHDAVHPDLGTLDDVAHLAATARRHGVDLALDLALQCSPDHPWVSKHPEWFVHRADGSIQYAENPPKKYEDIYPLDLEHGRDNGLWDEVLAVVLQWADLGVRTFRVDNPHTKPLELWRWLLAEVRGHHPDAIFLSEAFTRPRVMERLAKLGFDQSYTYFTWREEAWELREWMEQLTQTDLVEYLRPNVWPNTPDILPEHLQEGGPAMFRVRAILAATLAASWGVYGPAFELGEHRPRELGSEEYLDSEKYQLRQWNLRSKQSLAPLLTRLNTARREHPALQHDRWLHFHEVEGDDLLCYSKRTADRSDVVLCVVTTQSKQARSGLVHLDLEELGLDEDQPFEVHDLFTDRRFTWKGPTSYVALDPADLPAHLFVVNSPATKAPSP